VITIHEQTNNIINDLSDNLLHDDSLQDEEEPKKPTEEQESNGSKSVEPGSDIQRIKEKKEMLSTARSVYS